MLHSYLGGLVYQLRVFFPHAAFYQPTVIGVAICLEKVGHPWFIWSLQSHLCTAV